MSKYRVRLEYRTVITETVEAESEEEAIKIAESEVSVTQIGLEASSYSADATEI